MRYRTVIITPTENGYTVEAYIGLGGEVELLWSRDVSEVTIAGSQVHLADEMELDAAAMTLDVSLSNRMSSEGVVCRIEKEQRQQPIPVEQVGP